MNRQLLLIFQSASHLGFDLLRDILWDAASAAIRPRRRDRAHAGGSGPEIWGHPSSINGLRRWRRAIGKSRKLARLRKSREMDPFYEGFAASRSSFAIK